MNILITNDDGYDSKGILFLENKLKELGHNIYVVAPYSHMSGMSSSLTIAHPIKYHKISETKYAVEGTPVDAVSFGYYLFKDVKFDLVVSGVNLGANVSYDCLYSGTLGACQQALVLGISAIAFSVQDNLDGLDVNFVKIWNFVLEKYKFNKDFLMNVNYPIGKEMNDIRLSSLYYRHDEPIMREAGDGKVYMDRLLDTNFVQDDNDWYLLNNHIVSVTPLIKGNFVLEVLNKIKGE